MNYDKPAGLAPGRGKPASATPDTDRPSHSQQPAEATNQPDQDQDSRTLSSQAVSWWEVHLYRDRMLNRLGVQAPPMVGTVAWCDLADDDPVKLAAVIDAAQHWALRVDTAQEAQAAASQAISAAVDWAAVGRRNQQHADFLAANPWARRVAA
jgi:hypothetical protein